MTMDGVGLADPTTSSRELWDADHALTVLYAAHWRGLVRLAWLLLHDQEAAEETVQDAFVATYRRWSALRTPEAALPYLRSCTINGSRSALRRRSVRDRFTARHRTSEETTAASAEDSALRAGLREEVLATLTRLPVRQREVLVLRYYLELSEYEIAAALGISRGAVKTHASRAMHTLRAAQARTAEETS